MLSQILYCKILYYIIYTYVCIELLMYIHIYIYIYIYLFIYTGERGVGVAQAEHGPGLAGPLGFLGFCRALPKGPSTWALKGFPHSSFSGPSIYDVCTWTLRVRDFWILWGSGFRLCRPFGFAGVLQGFKVSLNPKP